MPLFIEEDDFRVVHACWDQTLIEEALKREALPPFDTAFIQRSADKENFEGKLMDRLTRGTDLALPEGRAINGKDGLKRRMFRTKFWSSAPKTFEDVAFQPDPLPEDIAVMPLHDGHLENLLFYAKGEKPVFVGHYWLQGRPKPLQPNVACLDYSAVKYGRLVAYRFDGESELCESKFEWVYVDPEEDV